MVARPPARNPTKKNHIGRDVVFFIPLFYFCKKSKVYIHKTTDPNDPTQRLPYVLVFLLGEEVGYHKSTSADENHIIGRGKFQGSLIGRRHTLNNLALEALTHKNLGQRLRR